MSTELKPTDEMFEAFLMQVCDIDDWSANQPARVFARPSAHGQWLPTPVEFGDPYDILPMAVAFASQEEQESMLFMYGWATRIPEDIDPEEFDEDQHDLERCRVRILVHMTHDRERMAVQFEGKMLEEQQDFGTGAFPDMIRELRNLQKGRFL